MLPITSPPKVSPPRLAGSNAAWHRRQIDRRAEVVEWAKTLAKGVALAFALGVLAAIGLPQSSYPVWMVLPVVLPVQVLFLWLRKTRHVPPLKLSHPPVAGHGDDAAEVAIKFFASDLELGSDRGYLWLDDGLLRYTGLGTSFAVSNLDLESLDLAKGPNDKIWVAIRMRQGYCSFSLEPVSRQNSHPLESLLLDWSKARDSRATELFPPAELQPRSLGWLMRKTLIDGWRNLLLLFSPLLIHGVLTGAGMPETVAWRVDALIVVGALHIFVVRFFRTKREEARFVRTHCPFAPPILESPRAGEFSVGVRLNAH